MAPESNHPVAAVSGASSGIGAATAEVLTRLGYAVVLGARRLDRLHEVAARCGEFATPLVLDVTSTGSVEAFAAEVRQRFGRLDVLVNNAGGALGLTPVAEADDEQWRWMYDANVLGTMRMTRALLPMLTEAAGTVVNIGSVAGVETYDGGAGYTAAKHGLRAVTDTLRLELLGTGVRVTEVAPGLVDTEFSLVRLGTQERADAVYTGMTPLVAQDIAEVIGFVVSRPPHVSLAYVRVTPTAQATATRVYRQT